MTENKKYDILTADGWKPFSGVSRRDTMYVFEVTTSSGKSIKATAEHCFMTESGEWTPVNKFAVGKTQLKNVGTVTKVNKIEGFEHVYDILNVGDVSHFLANEFVTHNSFHGTGSTLINGESLLKLRASIPEFIQNSLKIYHKPEKDHNYMIFVDVAKGRGIDYSAFSIIDISEKPFKQVATYRDNRISPLLLPDVIWKWAKAYNNAYVFIESNDQGSLVANGLYYELEYENVFVESQIKANAIGINMNKKVKRIGCSQLKDLVEEGKLSVIDSDTIIELSTFEARGSSYEARDGCHDDTVMTLVLLGYVTTLPFFAELTDKNIKSFIYQENIKMIEDELVPFGIIDNGIEDQIEVIDGVRWFHGTDKDMFKINE